MKALWHGQVIADSAATIDVDGYCYFPRAAVRMELLRAAAKTPGDRQCPHGVQFFDVTDGVRTSPRGAWSYEAPGAAMKKVDRWIGFWDEVEVQPG
jgi:uncharacterized protein (DUF427 family)